MLDFFRKYQRFLFIFVTVVTIMSFSFFGTYGAMDSSEEPKEIVVGHAIDGSKLKYSEIEQLARLLSSEPGKTGILETEILKTGVAERLVNTYFGPLKADLQTKLERAKRYKFYTHPSAPFLGAREIWSELAPDLVKEIENIQAMTEATPSFFTAWANLYFLQEKCPPEYVRRVLLYHQNQYRIPPDPRLASEDFALFGYKSREEWFGRDFMELCAQFVLNGAVAAEQRGFRVARGDADADLRSRFGGKGISYDLLLRSIGVRRNEAAAVWQKALLFSRYFQDVGHAALVDGMPYREFSNFSQEIAAIDLYRLPKELELKTIEDLVAFETYAKTACSPRKDPLEVPSSFLSAEVVAKKAPALVSTLYRFNCAEIDLRKVASKLSMRQVWDWQTADQHWAVLHETFPEIGEAASPDARFKTLEKLDQIRRVAIDDWSRRQIVQSNPEWIEQAFAAAAFKECEVSIAANGERLDGLDIQEVGRFQTALEGDAAELQNYLEGERIYRITDVQKVSEPSILSFAAAKEKSLIDTERFLEMEYRKIRGKMTSLFKNESGEWKPLAEVKELVIRQVFADLFRAIDRDENRADNGRGSLDFYVSHRFHKTMREALACAKNSSPSTELVAKDFSMGLWSIEKSEQTINRTSSEEWIMQQPFILQTDQWSPVYVPKSGEIVFFFLKNRAVKSAPILDQIQLGKQTLAADAKRQLTDRLLAAALKKQAIVLPLRTEGEKNDDL